MTAGRSTKPKGTDWGTPKKFVDSVRKFFRGGIALDPCSNQWSVVGADVEYRLPKEDGLSLSWDFPTIFVNPPYGSDKTRKTTIMDWLRMCHHAHTNHGSQVIALVPVATNTMHWKECVWGQASAICFVYDTRLKFLVRGKPSGKGAPMACAMVYWGSEVDRFTDVFSIHGYSVVL